MYHVYYVGRKVFGGILMVCPGNCQRDPAILFFILVYLLLFYDNSCLPVLHKYHPCDRDPVMLFFILIFLLLFYRPCCVGCAKAVC